MRKVTALTGNARSDTANQPDRIVFSYGERESWLFKEKERLKRRSGWLLR